MRAQANQPGWQYNVYYKYTVQHHEYVKSLRRCFPGPGRQEDEAKTDEQAPKQDSLLHLEDEAICGCFCCVLLPGRGLAATLSLIASSLAWRSACRR